MQRISGISFGWYTWKSKCQNCTDGPPIEWWDCEKMPKKTKTYNMTCIPLAALKCEAVKEEICKDSKLISNNLIYSTHCAKIQINLNYNHRFLIFGAKILDKGVAASKKYFVI